MSVVGDRQAIIDAVKGRRSIRRFLPTPVADETVLEIIEIAARAPSGQNMQPWLIHFVTGETRDALCRQVTEAADSGERRSEEHTSELQSLMRISYAVFCLKKKKIQTRTTITKHKTTQQQRTHNEY